MKNKLICILIMIFLVFGVIYINHTSYAGIHDVMGATADETNQLLFNKVATLQSYAESYKQEKNVSTSVGQLCMQYIRKDRYNSTAWKYMVGDIDTNFVNYVTSKNSSFKIDSYDKLIDKNSGKEIDFIHMMATLNAYVKPNPLVDKSFAGWAGDLMTLLGEVTQYRINNNITDTSVLQKYSNSLLGTELNSTFSRADALADLDAINLSLYSNINTNPYQALVDYYITISNDNSSFTRFETARNQLGNSRTNIKNDAKNRLSNSLMQTFLLQDNAKGKVTSSDIDILANSFVEYIYQDPYIEYLPSSKTVYIGVNDSIEFIGRNLDNIKLSYDQSYLSVYNNTTSLSVKGLKYGVSDISLYTMEDVLLGTVRVTIKNVAPSISSNLQTTTVIRIGINNSINFIAGGTNNVYNWYLLNDKNDTGTLFKTTSTSELLITINNFDLNNKYIRCSVTNEGNNEIFTIISKINVKDVAPSIITNLPTSMSIESGSSKTISFSAGGSNNKYTWYLTDSPNKTGSALEITKSPTITITPTVDMHNKYLLCVVSNSEENVVKTNHVRLLVKSESDKPIEPDDDEIIEDEIIITTPSDEVDDKKIKLPSYVYLIIEFVLFIIILKVILSALDNNMENPDDENNDDEVN